MEATRFVGFILLALIAGGVMALVLELLNTERPAIRADQAAAARKRTVHPVFSLPGFFAAAAPTTESPSPSGFDEALLALLQDHVKAEQAVVTEFVHFPSIESLHRQAHPALTMN